MLAQASSLRKPGHGEVGAGMQPGPASGLATVDMGLASFTIQTNSGKCAHVDLVSLMYNLLNKCDREQNPVFGPQRKPEVLLICMLNAFSMFDT